MILTFEKDQYTSIAVAKWEGRKEGRGQLRKRMMLQPAVIVPAFSISSVRSRRSKRMVGEHGGLKVATGLSEEIGGATARKAGGSKSVGARRKDCMLLSQSSMTDES